MGKEKIYSPNLLIGMEAGVEEKKGYRTRTPHQSDPRVASCLKKSSNLLGYTKAI